MVTETAESLPTLISGKVLTRQVINRNGLLMLQYFIATLQGPVMVVVPNAEYLCFCHGADVPLLKQRTAGQSLRFAPLPLESFSGQAVFGVYGKSGQSMRLLQRIANDLGISLFETDIKPEQRFLIERFIALEVEFLGHLSVDATSGEQSFIATRARKVDLATEVNLTSISLDFECGFDGELYSVGLYAKDYEKVIMVGTEQSLSPPYIEWVNDEAALIRALITWFAEFDPDVIIGWSVVTFDLALLYRRAKLHQIPLTLGRHGQLLTWKVEDKFRSETLSLPGRVVLDGIDWLKAAFYQFERYSLEFVARQLLGEGKAIHNVEHRGQEISHLFEHDKLALAHYNLTDSRLVWDIFEKTQLWDFVMARAALTGLELGRVGASVAAFNHLYLPHLHRAGYVAPHMPVSRGLESPGGYVMNSVPGLYRNMLVLDFKSLYPSIIRTFLIDPKGLIEGAKQNGVDTIPGFLGAQFSRRSPILPEIIHTLSEQRENAKREGNGPLSQAIKIIMNSLYGVLGSQGCVFHDAKLASSITMRGHEIMKQTRVWIEEKGYQVIYGDTDSTFVWLGDSPEEDPNSVGAMLVRDINHQWQQKIATDFQLPSYLEIEFERHYERFFMPTLRGSEEGSKKRYVGAYREHDSLQLVFKGMEQVRSDWSPLARRIQAQLYERLFNDLDITQYLADELSNLVVGKSDHELVFKKRLRRNLEDYTAKSSPHVKVAKQLLDRTGDQAFAQKGAMIEYIITVNGPEAISDRRSAIDYQYYMDKQIQPVSEPVFVVLKKSYSCIASKQMLLI